MVPPPRRACGDLEPAGRALEPAGRASEPAGWTLEPAGWALEPAERALEPAGRPGASWEGQLRGRGGGRRQKKNNGAFIVCGGTIGHRPLRGRCPKSSYIIYEVGRFENHCVPLSVSYTMIFISITNTQP